MSAALQAASALPSQDHLFHTPTADLKKALNKIIQSLAAKYLITFEVASENWLMKLRHNGVTLLTYGFDLGLNTSTSSKICDYKAATSSVLASATATDLFGRTQLNPIPHIEHRLFRKSNKNNPAAIREAIQSYAAQHNFNVVCKPKAGSGGLDICHVTTRAELEVAVDDLFDKYRELCVSPFHEIEHEIRVILLYGKPEIIFRKIRPHLIGNGTSTVRELLMAHYETTKDTNVFKLCADPAIIPQLEKKPGKGALVNLTWKHNLAQGASSEFIDIPSLDTLSLEITPRHTRAITSKYGPSQPLTVTSKIIQLARKAAEAVGVVFASVDIVQLKDGSLKVIEINSGIMMESLVRQHGQYGLERATAVYEKALLQLLPGLIPSPSTPRASSRATTEGSPNSSPGRSPLRSPQDSPQSAKPLPVPTSPPKLRKVKDPSEMEE